MQRSEYYTADDLLEMLKLRQGGYTQVQYAAEIGISPQLLSFIYQGVRTVGNDKVLAYLAPRGKVFVQKDVWCLVDDRGAHPPPVADRVGRPK
jgi:hypothetical protein